MKIKLLLSISVLFFLSAPVYGESYSCEKFADCEALGYKSDLTCSDGIKVSCPTDASKFYCNTVSPVINWPQAPLPILYGDGTVSKNILEDKKPIGVVFDEAKQLAVALDDIKKDGTPMGNEIVDFDVPSKSQNKVAWSSELCDIPELENCIFHYNDKTQSNVGACATDGKANTAAILTGTCSGEYPAAEACYKYEPSGCAAEFCRKTNWFLPSMRDGLNLANKKDELYKTFALLSVTGVVTNEPTSQYWSSTEASNITYGSREGADRNACYFLMSSPENNYCTYKKSTYNVRPVIKYPETQGSGNTSGGGSGITLPAGEWADCARICETHGGIGAPTGDTFIDESSCDCSLFGK